MPSELNVFQICIFQLTLLVFWKARLFILSLNINHVERCSVHDCLTLFEMRSKHTCLNPSNVCCLSRFNIGIKI